MISEKTMLERSERMKYLTFTIILVCVLLLLISGTVFAAQSFLGVPGKEYTDLPDIDQNSIGDPEQVLMWSGLGNVWNGNDFGGSGEIDSLANSGDAYFDQVIANQVSLIFSVGGWGNIFFEDPDGTAGIWATPAQINAAKPPLDVNSLEVWGPESSSDSNMFSLQGDYVSGVSVYAWNGAGSASWLSQAAIANAIGIPNLVQLVEVDGLMTRNYGEFDMWDDGDAILFSIAPITDPQTGALVFDGGEIWTWSFGGPAQFLNHGGHVWNTAFSVQNALGINQENINALEAVNVVPEPSSILILGSGIVGMAGYLTRRRKI